VKSVIRIGVESTKDKQGSRFQKPSKVFLAQAWYHHLGLGPQLL
jgi:hypothetical protein